MTELLIIKGAEEFRLPLIIRMGMEVNNPKLNQRRTSMIKFLGELYNYRIIDSPLIFKVKSMPSKLNFFLRCIASL